MRKNKETIYRCDYCSKPYHSSSSCKNHENNCFSDPKNKTCKTCSIDGFSNQPCIMVKNGLVKGDDISKNKDMSFVKNCSEWESVGY